MVIVEWTKSHGEEGSRAARGSSRNNDMCTLLEHLVVNEQTRKARPYPAFPLPRHTPIFWKLPVRMLVSLHCISSGNGKWIWGRHERVKLLQVGQGALEILRFIEVEHWALTPSTGISTATRPTGASILRSSTSSSDKLLQCKSRLLAPLHPSSLALRRRLLTSDNGEGTRMLMTSAGGSPPHEVRRDIGSDQSRQGPVA